MILEDFKNDNSYGHYANTLEMLLLCDIMMGTLDGSSLHSTIKSIQSSYQKYSSKIIPHIVSRVLFMASNIQSCRDLWKGDNRKSRPNFGLMMIKHSEKESIELNAMLLDQAARILKDYNDSSKAGFQYIMAGHMYNKMNLDDLLLHLHGRTTTPTKMKKDKRKNKTMKRMFHPDPNKRSDEFE